MTVAGGRGRASAALVLTLIVMLTLGWWLIARTTRDALIVYCAHDLIYASEVMEDFEKTTGIPVVVVGDTEATKSLGLTQRLVRERDDPTCDVFWNNQLLGTVELARQGVLAPYKGAHWESMPPQFRDDDGLWIGFGGRFRVWIFPAEAPPEFSPSFSDEDTMRDWSGLTIAQPMFGTTLSHYAILWQQLGTAGLPEWHRQMVEAGMRIVPGNASVKDLVASGVCTLGMTDTDDFYQAVDAGSSVAMQPIVTPEGETICIPNTVAIIRGTRRRSEAERLVDYLTSPEMEMRMARSSSRQVPLGDVDPQDLPADVQSLADWVGGAIDLKPLAEARDECLDWLTGEFAP